MKVNMTFIKLLLSSSLIYIATMATIISIDKTESVRRSALIDKLSNYVMPLHYNMELRLVNDYFICDCTIAIHITRKTQNISFHMLDARNNIRLSKLTQNYNETIYEKISTNYDKDNMVVFNYKDVLLPGIYNLSIRIEISIQIVKDSFGTSYINEDKVWLITTGIQSKEQQIFPIWKKTGLRITFDIYVRHYQKYKVLSNMPIRKSRPTYGDKMWTYFRTAGLIPINNIAFLVFDFHRINLTNITSIWCRPHLIPYVKFVSNIIKNITMHFENYGNNSKRFLEWTIVPSESKVDHVAIPNLQDDVKDIFGFVFYRETDIMYNEELDTIARKMIIALSVVRKMIQKYIGNLFNPFCWFHVWLNEGFILFFHVYIINETVPDFRMMELFIVQIQHELLDLNTYINLHIKYEDNTNNYLYSVLSRVKGSIIWYMLERILSPSIFLEAINIYWNQYTEPMETTSNNLWNAMQSIIDQLYFKYQFNIKNTVYSWAMHRCYPVLEVMQKSNIVTISAQFYNKLDEKKYYIPITYTTESELNFTITQPHIWLTPLNSKIERFLEKNQWIILNLQQTGYYRVNYDTENWQKIARYLNSEKYRNIHILNRAQIIDDAFHFAIEKKLEFSVFWELANYLQQEEDYIAWYPMIKAFEFMSNIVAFLEFYPQLLSFKEVLLKPLELKWNIYRRDNNNDHTEYLKQNLAKWKCLMNDHICKSTAYKQLELKIINPERISPDWKRWTYCNGLKMSNSTIWNKSFYFAVKEIDYTILECLAYSENFQINYLEKLLDSFETFRNIFMINLSYEESKSIERTKTLIANIFLSTLAKTTKYRLKNILNNFRKFTYYRTVNEMVILTVIINNVYSKEQLYEINKFIKDEIRESQYFFKALEDKVETRWSEIKKQENFFNLYTSKR